MTWGAKEAPSQKALTSMGHKTESFIRLLQYQAAAWKAPNPGPLYLNPVKPEFLWAMQTGKIRHHRYTMTHYLLEQNLSQISI